MGVDRQKEQDALAAARAVLAREVGSACLLDTDLRILEVNPAWNAFATANAGARCLDTALRGTRYVDHVDGPALRAKVASDLAQALLGETVNVDSECNSPDRFRHLRTHYLPVRAGDRPTLIGLLVVHSVIREAHITDVHDPHPPSEETFRGPHGLMTMCSCCRRVSHLEPPDTWRFVPDWVAEPPDRLSHGFCLACVLQYGIGEADLPPER